LLEITLQTRRVIFLNKLFAKECTYIPQLWNIGTRVFAANESEVSPSRYQLGVLSCKFLFLLWPSLLSLLR